MLEDVHFNGWLRDPPDNRDYRLHFHDDKPLPRQIDLRSHCSPVEDQRQIGSCVANAVVGAAEYLEAMATGSTCPPDLSRLFVYFNARYMQGTPDRDTGTYVRAAMASLAFYGVCLERIWPYEPSRFAEAPPQEAYSDAQRRLGLEYARLERGTDIKRALAAGLPVAFGTAIPKSCYEVAAQNGGYLPMPNEVPQDQIVGHSMLLVGYDLDQGYYILRNSWGEGWGDQGYGYAPLAMIDQYQKSDDFWVLRRMQQEGDYQVIRPANSHQPSCPACGTSLPANARFCSGCGTQIQKRPMNEGTSSSELFGEIERRRHRAQQELDRRLEENRRKLQEDIDRLLGRNKDRE